jgi:hypothetical protein
VGARSTTYIRTAQSAIPPVSGDLHPGTRPVVQRLAINHSALEYKLAEASVIAQAGSEATAAKLDTTR